MRNCFFNSHNCPQSLHSSNRRVPRIGVPVMQVAHHCMTMVRAHIYLPVIIFECLDQRYHIGVTFQVIGFVKMIIVNDFDAAKVEKMYSVAVLSYQMAEVVISPRPERATAETQSIGYGRYGFYKSIVVSFGTHNPWNAKNLKRGVIGVNRQSNPELF